MKYMRTPQLIGVAVPLLRELRAGVLAASAPADAVRTLREAGFAGGDAVYRAFEQWLGESGYSSPSSAGEGAGRAASLSLAEFGERTSRFFRDAGWGDVTFSSDESNGTAALDIAHCWEGEDPAAAAVDQPGCHITTGMLAAFFGRIAGYPVAVLETECSAAGNSRCRFQMGNADVMKYKWEEETQSVARRSDAGT